MGAGQEKNPPNTFRSSWVEQTTMNFLAWPTCLGMWLLAQQIRSIWVFEVETFVSSRRLVPPFKAMHSPSNINATSLPGLDQFWMQLRLNLKLDADVGAENTCDGWYYKICPTAKYMLYYFSPKNKQTKKNYSWYKLSIKSLFDITFLLDLFLHCRVLLIVSTTELQSLVTEHYTKPRCSFCTLSRSQGTDKSR